MNGSETGENRQIAEFIGPRLNVQNAYKSHTRTVSHNMGRNDVPKTTATRTQTESNQGMPKVKYHTSNFSDSVKYFELFRLQRWYVMIDVSAE